MLPARWFSRQTAVPVSWSLSATPVASARPSYATSKSARWRRRNRRSKNKVSDRFEWGCSSAHVLLSATRCHFNNTGKVMPSKQRMMNPWLAFNHECIESVTLHVRMCLCVCIHTHTAYAYRQSLWLCDLYFLKVNLIKRLT